MLRLETRNWPQNQTQLCIKGGIGKAKTMQPGKYKLYKTFCHLILGFQQFVAPRSSCYQSSLSYDMKILSWEIHLVSGSGALIIKWLGSSFSLQDIIVIYVM